MTLTLSIQEARRVALAAGSGAGLANGFAGDAAESGLAALRAIGFVQIDTISVLRRAHDHVLWSRAPAWQPEAMAALERAPRRVIEYWAHAAAYLPVEDWRFCRPRMRRIARDGHEWHRFDPAVADEMMARIREGGPLRTREASATPGGGGVWWDWKPAKVALEYLFHAGALVTAGREGFQKVYDLAERHVPAEQFAAPEPDAEEMARWYVDRAVASLGVFAETEMTYQRRDATAQVGGEVASRLADGRLMPVRLAGEGRAPRLLAAPDVVASALNMPEPDELRLRFLSPFDPLIIQRKRAQRLFGLEYTIECYVPAAKRQFGYFTLPVLSIGPRETCFVGLVDAVMDRARATLVIRRARIETPPADANALLDALSRELAAFARFNGANRVECEQVESESGMFARRLRARLKVDWIRG